MVKWDKFQELDFKILGERVKKYVKKNTPKKRNQPNEKKRVQKKDAGRSKRITVPKGEWKTFKVTRQDLIKKTKRSSSKKEV